MLSRQGINIAFIGMDMRAQTAMAEYLVRNLEFKRMELDDTLKTFLRTSYFMKQRNKIGIADVRRFYHAVYKVDNDIFIKDFKNRFEISEGDVVTANVMYLNELRALQELGFTIVRVTSKQKKPDIGKYVKNANDGTLALSMMYDKRFAVQQNVDYSVHFNGYPGREAVLTTLLTNLGYQFEKKVDNAIKHDYDNR